MKKKYFYLLALASMAFSACTKADLPPTTPATGQPANGQAKTATLSITLQAADYQKLASSVYSYKTFTFDNATDAENNIPTILNSEYANVADGSTAAVTYNISSPYFKLTDSVYADVAYTLTSDDYKLLPGNKYTDFSIAQLLQWLPYKYPTPVKNQLALITYNFYQSGVTPSAGVATTGSAIYVNGAWQYIYTLSAGQYTALGRGNYGEIVAADNATLPKAFNALLKSDASITDTIQKGDMVYVSYKYYASGTFQRVLPMIYDGANYVTTATVTNSLNFIKKSGKWQFVQPLPVISYTCTTADYTLISNSTAGTSAARANLAQYGDFDSDWTTAYMDAAMIVVLKADFTTPAINTIYAVSFKNYSSPAPNPLKFIWDGTQWVAQQ